MTGRLLPLLIALLAALALAPALLLAQGPVPAQFFGPVSGVTVDGAPLGGADVIEAIDAQGMVVGTAEISAGSWIVRVPGTSGPVRLRVGNAVSEVIPVTAGDSQFMATLVLTTPSSPASTDIGVEPGWNQIAWVGPETPVAAAFNTAIISRVSTWDATARRYISFDAALPAALNELQSLRPGDGLWVFATRSAELQVPVSASAWQARSVPLKVGFNLVGFTGPDESSVAEIFGALAYLVKVYHWDDDAHMMRAYDPALPPALSNLASIDFGDAVWVQVSHTDTLRLPAP